MQSRFAIALLIVSVVLVAACGDDSGGATSMPSDSGMSGADGGAMSVEDGGGSTDDGAVPITDDAGPMPAEDGGMPPPAGDPTPPGSMCAYDRDCAADGDHAGLCVFGICMTRATADCASAGSTAECAMGSRCWGLEAYGSLCWPDCATFTCAGACDGDGSCAPTMDSSCEMCGSTCCAGPCSPDYPRGACAGADQVCLEGSCVDGCSPANPSGYCPADTTCTDGACVDSTGCPSWMCTGPTCSDIVAMPGADSPSTTEAMMDGYYRSSPAQYSFLRRDLTMLIQYAVCRVNRHFPGTTPLALGDLAQSDGLTPGTDVGSPRHPTSTHNGNDADLAYYQTDGANNYQIVCGDGSDRNGNGVAGRYNDGYFCTTMDNIVDWDREAYLFAMLASTPLARVFGLDQTFPDAVRMHLTALHDRGELTDAEYGSVPALGYGASGGWQFHHHHSHMSYCPIGGC